MNTIDLQGRFGVVTGGAQGVGLAIATRMMASGANIALWDIGADAGNKVASLKSEYPGAQAIAIQTDVSHAGSVQEALEETRKAFGRVDLLVNNAGIAGPNALTWEYPKEDWRRVLEVNLVGTFLVSRAIIPLMLENAYGRIVNIASVAGKEGNPNASAYSASKAGIIGLTKSLGKELAKTGVRVNCVTPAALRTSLLDEMSQEHVNYMLSKIPMERLGEPREVASLVAWLCSEECSFSTGAVFDLSGGRATY